jgi:hypothetical protein
MEKLSIFQQSTPLSRQHTRRGRIGKNKTEGISPAETSGADLKPWRRGDHSSRSWSRPAAGAQGGGHRQQFPMDAGSRGSVRQPAARAPQLPPRRQSCAAVSFCQPAPAPAGRVRHLASPSIPHPRSHRPPGGRVATVGRLDGSNPFSGAYSRSPGGGNWGIVTAGGILDQGEEESRVGNRGVVTAGCMLDQGSGRGMVSGEQRRRRRNEAEKGSRRACIGKVQE